MQWYLKVMRQYADFNGRARRTEYWMYTLFFAIFYIVAIAIDAMIGTLQNGFPVLTWIVILAHILPSLAVTVRRLHDTDRSGWWYFISFVPLAGPIILIVFNATEGTRGPNQYGQDPKMPVGPPPVGYPQPGQPYVA